MSIFIPYNIIEVETTFERWFNISLINLTDYQSIMLTLMANIYFFGFWFFVIYFSLKGLNWVYERLC